jgi:hypothetical protein
VKLPHPTSAVCTLVWALAGAAVVGSCGDEASFASAGPPAAQASAACGVALEQLALYQGVKVVLAAGGTEVRPRNAPVIAGRPALLRAFVTATPGLAPGPVTATLALTSAGQTRRYQAQQALSAAASDADLATTVNFSFGAEAIGPDTELSLELTTPACADGGGPARFPADGRLPLAALATGTLQVRLVPVRYDADGSGRMPDVSPAQLARLRSRLLALFPVADVQLSLAPVMATTTVVSARGGWSELLEQLRHRRARDPAPSAVYDYGLVTPAASSSQFCAGACVGGLSYVVTNSGPGGANVRVGVGLGYPGLAAADVMAHELGHLHGRGHAPCGTSKEEDGRYPYAGGQTGVWGLEPGGATTLRPPSNKDLMSYCEPRWISDYTFGALAARSAAINDARVALPLRLASPPPERWRVLLVNAAGEARWGSPAAGDPPGAALPAQELDAAGAPLANTAAWMVPLGDGETRAYWLSRPGAGAHAVRFADAPPVILPPP